METTRVTASSRQEVLPKAQRKLPFQKHFTIRDVEINHDGSKTYHIAGYRSATERIHRGREEQLLVRRKRSVGKKSTKYPYDN